jgi:hypothetical protein
MPNQALCQLGVQIGFGGVEFRGNRTNCGLYEILMSRKEKKETKRNVPVFLQKGRA